MADTLTAAELPVSTPARLTALCALWQAEEREVWITLNGGSMSPTILPGTRLCLRCSSGPPALGDIIAYRQENILVVHRLLEITGLPDSPQLVCLGDGNIFNDRPVAAQAFVGTVTRIAPIPVLQRALFALRHPRRHARFMLRRLQAAPVPR